MEGSSLGSFHAPPLLSRASLVADYRENTTRMCSMKTDLLRLSHFWWLLVLEGFSESKGTAASTFRLLNASNSSLHNPTISYMCTISNTNNYKITCVQCPATDTALFIVCW